MFMLQGIIQSPRAHNLPVTMASCEGVQGLKGQASMLFAQVKHLGHLTPTDGLLINLERHRGILLSSSRSSEKAQRFCMVDWILSQLGSNFSLMAQPLYVLWQSDQSDPFQWNSEGKQAVSSNGGIVGSSHNGHPNYELISFLFIHGRKGNASGVLTQKHGDRHRPVGYYSQQ